MNAGCFFFSLFCGCVMVMAALSMKESCEEQQTVVKFLSKSGHKPNQCWQQLHDVFGADCFSKNSVRHWHRQFQQGRTSTKDVK